MEAVHIDRMLSAGGYGICLFSADTLQDFLKREKIRKRKLLSLFQNDKELYITTQKEGIWIPIVQINYGNYMIKLAGQDEPFDDSWEQKIDYNGFNLEIKDGLWISAIQQLEPFESKNYHVTEEIFHEESSSRQAYWCSPYESWFKTMDGITDYTDIKYDVPTGKYLVSIKGYIRKEPLPYPNPNCGFLFSLTKVEEFSSFKNPRESDDYDFNIGSMK